MDELLKNQIGEARRKLGDLMREAKRNAPVATGPQKISITLTRAELDEMRELARRSRTSISALGQRAVKHLLLQSRSGALPMLPPSSVDTAVAVDILGRPID